MMLAMLRQPRLLVMTATATALSGCAAEPPPDETSAQIVALLSDGPPPERVVSLIPAVTELIVTLGQADRIVGLSQGDSVPGRDSIPSVGGMLNPSYEQLLQIQPDLVVAWAGSRVVLSRLQVLGIRALGVEVETLEDSFATLAALGVLFNVSERADSIRTAIDSGILMVRQAVATFEPRSVFYVVWDDPPITTGPGTYINELIEMAGGRNVFVDAVDKWPTVSFEAIVSRNPDVVIWPRTSGADPAQQMMGVGWREVEAVRSGNVAIVDATRFNSPGPQIVEVVRELSRILHPEVDLGQVD